ncbi:hypothetical protein [Nocardia sp. IFM 10818]
MGDGTRAALVVAASLVLAGCSSDPSTPVAPTGAEADRQAAQAAVFVLADVPSGYREKRPGDSGISRPDQEEHPWTSGLLTCLGVDASAVGRSGPWAKSASFESPGRPRVVVSSEIDVMASGEAAAAEIELPRHPDMPRCMVASTAGDTGDGTGGSVFVFEQVELLDYPSYGEGSVAVRAQGYSKVGGVKKISYVDTITARVGNRVVTVQLGALDEPVSQAQADPLVQRAVERATQR